MTCLAGREYPAVTTASPAGRGACLLASLASSGPAARWIAPSTPPPPARVALAALTIASTSSVVMSPVTISTRDTLLACDPHHDPALDVPFEDPVDVGVEVVQLDVDREHVEVGEPPRVGQLAPDLAAQLHW